MHSHKLLQYLSVPTWFSDPDEDILDSFGIQRKEDSDNSDDPETPEKDEVDFKKAITDPDETPVDDEQDETDDNEEDTPEDEPKEEVKDENEKVYRINKQEFTYEELAEKVLDEYGIAKGVLSKKALEKLVTDYTNSNNLKAGKRSVNEGHRANAETRKALTTKQEQLNRQEQQLKAFETELAKRKAESEKVMKIDDDDEDYLLDEDKRLELKLDKREAAKELKTISEQEKKAKEVKEAILSEREDLHLRSLIYDLQEEFPELKTAGDVEKLLNRFEEDVINDETLRAYAIINIIKDYKNDTVKPKSITTYYKVNENKYKSLIPANDNNRNKVEKKAENKAEKIIKKQQQNPTEPKGSSSVPEGSKKPTKTKAETMASLGLN